MNTEILMGASAVITISACYVGWYYAKRAEQLQKLHDGMVEYANRALLENIDLQRERDRLSDLVGTYQAKAPEREANGQFASKRKAVTAELQAYVASKKAA